MTERLGYGTPHYHDYDDDQQNQESQVEDIPWYVLADPDYSPEEEEGAAQEGLEDFQERNGQVEYQADFVEDDVDQSEFEAQFGWRSKARRRKKGRRLLPDMRGYVAPVFVRAADLEAGSTLGSGDAKKPNTMAS